MLKIFYVPISQPILQTLSAPMNWHWTRWAKHKLLISLVLDLPNRVDRAPMNWHCPGGPHTKC